MSNVFTELQAGAVDPDLHSISLLDPDSGREIFQIKLKNERKSAIIARLFNFFL